MVALKRKLVEAEKAAVNAEQAAHKQAGKAKEEESKEMGLR